MPLYEYECDACGHRFEHIHQKFSDPPIEKCPKCGGAVHKLMSSPAIQFKGSGFYITDYAKKDTVAGGKTEGQGSEGKGDAQGGTTAESGAKTESKGETGTSSSSNAGTSQSAPAKPPAAPTKSD